MGKTKQVAPYTRAHRAIRNAAQDAPREARWYVSKEALYWFEMLDEYVTADYFHNVLPMVGKIQPFHFVEVDGTLSANSAELRNGTDIIAILDLPQID